MLIADPPQTRNLSQTLHGWNFDLTILPNKYCAFNQWFYGHCPLTDFFFLIGTTNQQEVNLYPIADINS